MCEKARERKEKESVSLIRDKKKLFLGGVWVLGMADLLIQLLLMSQDGGSKNKGFGWGLPFSLGWQGELRWPLVGLSILGLLGIGWWYKISKRSMEKLGLLMVILGGVINLVMRLIWGEVMDYLCVVGLCFNVADILITGGVLLVIRDSIKEK